MQIRERLNFIDTIRVIAVLLVVISHMNHALEQCQITIRGNSYILPSTFANGDFGTLGVSLFFIISGLSLYYNYESNFNVRMYYKKRFLNIYPKFWCSYSIVFLLLFVKYKEFWFERTEEVPTSRFVLSILGLDGYFTYLGSNFYLIGEWFLGCIIFLYIGFPVLRTCVKKHPVFVWLLASVIYMFVVLYNPFKIDLTRNLLIRGYDFLVGMLLARFISKIDTITLKMSGMFISFGLFVFALCYVPNEKFHMCMITLMGVSLFVFLMLILQQINLERFFLVKIINKYSFDIFLLHHVTISMLFAHFKGQTYSLFEGVTLMGVYVVALSVFILLMNMFKTAVTKWLKNGK